MWNFSVREEKVVCISWTDDWICLMKWNNALLVGANKKNYETSQKWTKTTADRMINYPVYAHNVYPAGCECALVYDHEFENDVDIRTMANGIVWTRTGKGRKHTQRERKSGKNITRQFRFVSHQNANHQHHQTIFYSMAYTPRANLFIMSTVSNK